MRRVVVLLVSLAVAALTQLGVAWAQSDPSLPPCVADPAHAGQLASCTYDGSGHIINVTYDDPFGGSGGQGMPGFVVPLFVVVALIGLGVFLVKLSLARGMAREAGLDPDRAGWVTALSDDGLAATYLATATSSRSGAAPTRAARLAELDDLRARGLIPEAEYADRRQAVLDEI